MQDKLIILLRAKEPTNPRWITELDGYEGEVAQLAKAAVGRKVIVIVPAEDVLLLEAVLPSMSRTRLRQALPFALEEQLVAEVEDLHFAVGDKQANGYLPVAVVARAKMQEWLALLTAWQVIPAMIVPLTLAIPSGHAVIFDDVVVCRAGQVTGFIYDKQNDTHQVYRHDLQGAIQCSDELLRENAPESLTLNLLQGDYAITPSRLPKLQGGMKLVMGLIVAWLGLLFICPAISWMLLARHRQTLEAQMMVIYRRHFPDARSLIAPQLRLQEKWRAVSMGDGGGSRLLYLLSCVGRGMQLVNGVKLKQFDFQGGQMALQLVAATADDLAEFTDYLTRQKLSVKNQNAIFEGGLLSGTLQIR